jgi:hypothetical protein
LEKANLLTNLNLVAETWTRYLYRQHLRQICLEKSGSPQELQGGRLHFKLKLTESQQTTERKYSQRTAPVQFAYCHIIVGLRHLPDLSTQCSYSILNLDTAAILLVMRQTTLDYILRPFLLNCETLHCRNSVASGHDFDAFSIQSHHSIAPLSPRTSSSNVYFW